ncbi:MAG: DUF975 family protein [Eubacteriales bacterium]|nr:DUF975 family protein [Eubacteriales bacterium]
MWTRYDLKMRAKEVVRRFYLASVLVCLITGIFAGNYGSGNNGSESSHTEEVRVTNETMDHGDLTQPVRQAAKFLFGSITGLIFLTMGAVVSILGILLKVLVGNPLEVGEQHFFLKAQMQHADVSEVLYAFRSGCYGNIVLTTFLQKVKIFLWSLLLVIPGIVKSYEYYLVPYLLAENPNLDQARIFELSRQMMEGQKMEAFILDLSFLPWQIFGSVTLNLGNVFWTKPYMAGTRAELYSVLRADAINRGITNTYELPGIAY